MSDYFEERKRESEKRDDYWQKRKEEAEIADKTRYIELRQKYAGKYDDRYQNVKPKPVKKPKKVLTVAEKKALTAKRKRTAKKIVGFIKRAIYGKPKRKPTKRKTATKKKK